MVTETKSPERVQAMRGKIVSLLLLGLITLGLSCAPERKKDIKVEKEKDAPPPKVELPAEMKPRIEATLKHVHARSLETTFSFWTIFHGILGMGLDTEVLDRNTGKKLKAIDFVCAGKDSAGQEVRGLKFEPHPPHGLDVRIGPVPIGQGHQDQFLAEMIQWGIARDKPIRVDGVDYTFLDLIRYSKQRASATKSQELGWAILVIADHYGVDVPPWTNMDGDKVSLQDLLRAELNADMAKAACGGTHSLFGLTWVYHLYLQKGGKIEGVWADVSKHLLKYKEAAKQFQNPDGTFADTYVNGPGATTDPDRRINTTGHVLEWLALYLPDDELRAPWVQDAVMVLCKTILDRSHTDIDSGSLYHATHGLHLYYDRVFATPETRSRSVMPLPPKGKA
ncbi:MAG: hypothetical protein U0793_06740 [Gemmataceae bacterium]